MLFDIEVRPGPDSDFFQYYTETVEANTHSDAVARVERRNPGCICRCTNSYNAPRKSGGGSDGGLDAGSTTGAIILGGGLLGFLMFTPWVMMGVGGAAGTWIAQKVTGYSVEEFTEDKNPSEGDQKKAVAIFCTAVLLGGMGFVWGDNFKKGIEAEMNTSSIAAEVRKA